MRTVEFLITGKVQGVWFRASTQKVANEIGVTGCAKNLLSGQVEVTATGTQQQLDLLYAYLQSGPEQAIVETIEIAEKDLEQFEQFDVG